MKRSALFCLLLALAACNTVTTTNPLFTRADEAGAPKLKPGVWAGPKSADCAFDEGSPIDTWPSCANGMVIDRAALGSYDKANGVSTLTKTDYILAGGEPMILQIRDVPDSAPGQAAGYLYATVRPVKTDDIGLITVFGVWPVLCGPPPPENASKDGKSIYGTLKPVAGMVMDKDNDDCTTDNAGTVRAAAAASEQWEPTDITDLHWVRDGDK
jgi:hypothetical protein